MTEIAKKCEHWEKTWIWLSFAFCNQLPGFFLLSTRQPPISSRLVPDFPRFWKIFQNKIFFFLRICSGWDLIKRNNGDVMKTTATTKAAATTTTTRAATSTKNNNYQHHQNSNNNNSNLKSSNKSSNNTTVAFCTRLSRLALVLVVIKLYHCKYQTSNSTLGIQRYVLPPNTNIKNLKRC